MSSNNAIATNRKAYYDYQIEENLEAGIVLAGWEVPVIRMHRPSLTDVYAGLKNGELYLFNFTVPAYKNARSFQPNGSQVRGTQLHKLLIHKRELKRIIGQIKEKGRTLVALKLYFNDNGKVKILLGLGVGKTKYDKREAIKKRDWERKARSIKAHYI